MTGKRRSGGDVGSAVVTERCVCQQIGTDCSRIVEYRALALPAAAGDSRENVFRVYDGGDLQCIEEVSAGDLVLETYTMIDATQVLVIAGLISAHVPDQSVIGRRHGNQLKDLLGDRVQV